MFPKCTYLKTRRERSPSRNPEDESKVNSINWSYFYMSSLLSVMRLHFFETLGMSSLKKAIRHKGAGWGKSRHWSLSSMWNPRSCVSSIKIKLWSRSIPGQQYSFSNKIQTEFMNCRGRLGYQARLNLHCLFSASD